MTNSPFSEKEWHLLVVHLKVPQRQAQILRCILEGKADAQIAEELGLGTATIRTHLGRMFQRFEVRDRVQLVVEIFRAFRHLECRQRSAEDY